VHSETVHYRPGKPCGSVTAAIIAAFTTMTLAAAAAPIASAVVPDTLVPVIATELPPSVEPDAGDARHRRRGRRRRVGVERVGQIGAGRCRRQHIRLPLGVPDTRC
jgi:hypothetical protein